MAVDTEEFSNHPFRGFCWAKMQVKFETGVETGAQAGYFAEALKAIASMPPGHCHGAL